MFQGERHRVVDPGREGRDDLAQRGLLGAGRQQDGHIDVARQPGLAPALDRDAADDRVRNAAGAEEGVESPGGFELGVHRQPLSRRRSATRSWIARRSMAALSPSARDVSQTRTSPSYSARASSTVSRATRRSVSLRSQASARRCPSRKRLRSSRETMTTRFYRTVMLVRRIVRSVSRSKLAAPSVDVQGMGDLVAHGPGDPHGDDPAPGHLELQDARVDPSAARFRPDQAHAVGQRHGGHVTLPADMPYMALAHSVRPVRAKAGGGGIYSGVLELEMTGRWVIAVRITGPVSDQITHTLDIHC